MTSLRPANKTFNNEYLNAKSWGAGGGGGGGRGLVGQVVEYFQAL